MNTDSWQIASIVTIAFLVPILLISIFIGIRAKSAQAGLRLFLLFSIILVAAGFILWGLLSLPDEIFNSIFKSVFIASTILMVLSGVIHWLNNKRIGKTITNSGASATTNHLSILIGLRLIIWAVSAIIFFISADINSGSVASSSLFALLVASNVFKDVFSTFQIREKGFTYHAKVFLYSDIEHAEWENPRDKTKLKIRLKNKEREVVIKTPWEMNIQIDNYLRSNFHSS